MDEQVIGQIRVNKSATFLYHNTIKSVSFEIRYCIGSIPIFPNLWEVAKPIFHLEDLESFLIFLEDACEKGRLPEAPIVYLWGKVAGLERLKI